MDRRSLVALTLLALAGPSYAQSELFSNGARTTLGAGITNVATAITVDTGTGGMFPTITGADYFKIVVCAAGAVATSACEIMTITAHAAASDSMTAVRGQDGTAAATWLTTAQVRMNVLASTLTRHEAAAPSTRSLTAGAGLTGGGDLSANRTFDVACNADASLVCNANDIQVGVLASDAQHGVRGGGTQHAAAVASGASGFLTGTDKAKLDGITAGAAVASVSASSPLSSTGGTTPTLSIPTVASGSVFALAGGTTVAESFRLTGTLALSLSANQDDYAGTGYDTATHFRVSTDASRNFTGIAGGAAGRYIQISNSGSNPLVLVHDATSTAANRFYCPGSINLTLSPNDTVWVRYDGSVSRWRVVGTISRAAGSTTQLQYNSSGALAGAANVVITSDYLNPQSAATPSVPSNGYVTWSGQLATGMPQTFQWLTSTDQAGAFRDARPVPMNYVTATWAPFSASAFITTGPLALAFGGGTASAPTTANTSAQTRQYRYCEASSASAGTGGRVTTNVGNNFYAGSGYEGFTLWQRGITTPQLSTTPELLFGVAVATNSATDPSAHVNYVACTVDPGETTWRIRHNDGSGTATAVDCGSNFPVSTTSEYDCTVYAQYNSANWVVVMRRLDSSVANCSSSFSSDAPAAGTALGLYQNMNNGSNAAVTQFCSIGGAFEIPRVLP